MKHSLNSVETLQRPTHSFTTVQGGGGGGREEGGNDHNFKVIRVEDELLIHLIQVKNGRIQYTLHHE